jgi:ElaB/YqjD/DUF883 family membrane-anchored ribosome-binding protein
MSAPPAQGPGGSQSSRAEGQGGLTGTLSEAAGQVRDKVQDVASGVAGRVGDAWESTRQGVRQGADYVTRRAQDLYGDTNEMIRRNPLAAVALAFGVGCLVGCCLAAVWSSREDYMTERMSRSSA